MLDPVKIKPYSFMTTQGLTASMTQQWRQFQVILNPPCRPNFNIYELFKFSKEHLKSTEFDFDEGVKRWYTTQA